MSVHQTNVEELTEKSDRGREAIRRQSMIAAVGRRAEGSAADGQAKGTAACMNAFAALQLQSCSHGQAADVNFAAQA
jgi:hypothetical protein